jgi:peptide/nickel transport system substrate-binding protein
MKQRRSWQKLLALLAAMTLVMAACGGGTAETTTTAAGETTTTAAGETTTTAAMTTTTAGAATGGVLQVAVLNDINTFDPMAFSAVNFPYLRNVYDSLIDYTNDGTPIPWLAESWEIADDFTSVTVNLREGVMFHAGGTMDAEAVAKNLEKAAHPEHGRNIFATMSIVEGWEVVDANTVRIDFVNPTAEQQITDLLQFMPVIDPELIDIEAAFGEDPVANTAGGTGPFKVESRSLGQSIVMVANEDWWGDGPILDGITLTIFDDADAATAALESGTVHMIYNVGGQDAKRLQETGEYDIVVGPGPLVQVLRMNVNRGPFQNKLFRQAMLYALDRESILEVGYAGLGVTTVLPWVPTSTAADPSYDETYAYNLDKARQLLDDSGLTQDELEDFEIHVGAASGPTFDISQIFQADLARLGINVELAVYEGQEATDRLLSGNFAVLFGGIGNIQKFPTRVATNSIYRTAANPVLGDATPQAYIDAIEQVNRTLGPPAEIQAALDNLNAVLVDEAFAAPTNTYPFGLIVHSNRVSGWETLNIDNMLVGWTLRLEP